MNRFDKRRRDWRIVILSFECSHQGPDPGALGTAGHPTLPAPHTDCQGHTPAEHNTANKLEN